MKISGKINRITNLANFAVSFLKNAKAPDEGSYQSAGDILVQVVFEFKDVPASFIPPVSFKTKSKADGSFSIAIPASFDSFIKQNPDAYLLCYRQKNNVIAGMNIPILEPVYRCQTFNILRRKKNILSLYFAIQPVPDASGISQNMINKMAGDKIKELKQAKFSGTTTTIKEGKISFHTNATAKGHTAVINFNIVPQIDVSSNLNQFLRPKIKDLDIDMPGPDFLANCISPVDEDEIEKMIRSNMNGLSNTINAEIKKTIIASIAKLAKQKEATIKVLLDEVSVVSFTKFRYPVTGNQEIKLPLGKTLQIPIRSVVPELSIGFPRKIE